MKIFNTFVLVLIVAFFASPVSAAPQANAVFLIEVRNDKEGGIIFVFQVNGKISKANLNNGFAQVEGGDSYGLHCNQTDDTRVQCSTSKKASGKNVVIGFAGTKFWAYVPESKAVEPIYQCYNVYDWDDNFNPSAWVNYGTYCQDFLPQDGDEIIWNNPILFPPYVYWYSSMGQPSWCSWTGSGPGYYYFYCP